MHLLKRFNLWALLLVAIAIVAVQQLRPRLLHLSPGLTPLLNVGPNFVAGVGLPFGWAAETRRTTVDPALGVRLVADRLAIEHAFREVPDPASRSASGLFGVVESDMSALMRLLSDVPLPPQTPPTT